MTTPFKPSRDSRAETIANTIGTVDHPRRHDEDGRVYLAYFRNDVTTGFMWDGCIEHPIQVTREMGEPVIDTLDMFDPIWPDSGPIAPQDLFATFKRLCDAYADHHEKKD